ncbi:MAG: hypothetical protein K2X99_00680 [Gemmatimonadaceae bacterium]|nr:hypothetical protein [Gemmatimonadaceae bacterium]
MALLWGVAVLNSVHLLRFPLHATESFRKLSIVWKVLCMLVLGGGVFLLDRLAYPRRKVVEESVNASVRRAIFLGDSRIGHTIIAAGVGFVIAVFLRADDVRVVVLLSMMLPELSHRRPRASNAPVDP